MAKNRTIAGFEDVAGEKKTEETPDNINVNENEDDKANDNEQVNENTNTNENEDVFDLNSVNKSDKVLDGFYLDPEVKKALQKLNKKMGKGKKSEFANHYLKKALKENGLL